MCTSKSSRETLKLQSGLPQMLPNLWILAKSKKNKLNGFLVKGKRSNLRVLKSCQLLVRAAVQWVHTGGASEPGGLGATGAGG